MQPTSNEPVDEEQPTGPKQRQHPGHGVTLTVTISVTEICPRLKPNSTTLAGSKLLRSWLELKFGLSSSLLAAN